MAEVFGGLFTVLVLASVAGYLLERRQPSLVTQNLNARIRAWWVMIAAGGLVLWAGRYAILALFAALSWLALREFMAPLRWRDWWPCFLLALPAQYLCVALSWPVLFALAVPLAALFVRERRVQLGLLLCVYGLGHVPALLLLPGDPRPLVLYLVLVVQASDVLQYIWGRLLGRHAIAPRWSPAKTVEGLVGGIACAGALGALLSYLTPFAPLAAGLVSLGITLAGFASGLVFSAIKRQRGIKDWGTAIQGHGGILDRVDSLCLAAPLFYYLLRYR